MIQERQSNKTNTKETASRRSRLFGLVGVTALAILAFTACDSQQPNGADCTPAKDDQIPIDIGQGTEYIDPQLWATLQRHANGDSGLPASMTMALGWEWPEEDAIFKAIEDAGGVRDGEDEYMWRIPTENILAILQRPDVFYAEIPPPEGFDQRATATVEAVQSDQRWPPTEPMNHVLADVVKAYCLGIAAEQAAQYALFSRGDSVAVRVVNDDAETKAGVRAWLDDRNIYAPNLDHRVDRSPDDYDIGVLLPVAQIDPLAQAFFPKTYLIGEDHQGQGLPLDRFYWPAEAIEYEEAVTEPFLESYATPTP